MAKRGFPYAPGQVVADIPYMVEQWDFEKNVGVDIKTLPVSSKSPYYFWKCKKCGYPWESPINSRLYSTGKCPCCELNRVIVPGINDLLTIHPDAARTIDIEANAAKGIRVETLSPANSNPDVAWHCKKCGHEWTQQVQHMVTINFKCPRCELKKGIVPGVNDVLTLVPELKKYYDFEKNEGFDIYSQGVSSNQKVIWTCPVCDRSWEASILSRIKGTSGNYAVRECPHYNTTKRTEVLTIAQTPKMLKFWDYEKNILDPNSTPTNSTEQAFWKCPKCKYEWPAMISSREQSTHKCPSCELNLKKIAGVSDLFTLVPAAKLDYDFEKNVGIDIENLGVCSKVPVWWKCHKCGKEWKSPIIRRVIGKQGSYSLRNCQQCYHNSRRISKKIAEDPKLLKFWDFHKNKNLGIDPNLTLCSSSETAYWRCKNCGHEWEQRIDDRYKHKADRCPECDNLNKVVPGKTDIFTVIPDIQRVYDFEKNKDIDISRIGVGSLQVVNFKCPSCLREWSAPISYTVKKLPDGTYRMRGCSDCETHRYRKTSYADQYPDLIDRFDEERNGFPFSDLHRKAKASTTDYWWLCDACGNSFEATVGQVISAQRLKTNGCPYCSKRIPLPGESFAEKFPELMAEYSPNNEIDPYKVLPTSKKQVEWICKNDPSHTWVASFVSRSSGGGKCPACYRTRAVKGLNTLEDKHPELISWWSSNNEKLPSEVLFESGIWYKWICPDCNGEFSRPIHTMAYANEKCPYCADRKVLPGLNSLADKYPEIAKLYSSKNEKPATRVLPTFSIPVLWHCLDCHGEYTAPIDEMVAGTYDCPYCNDRRVLPGFNSLAAKHPNLLNEWYYLGNCLLGVDPDQILPKSSSTLVWWCCSKNQNHKYLMSPARRLLFQKRKMEPCLYCKGLRRKKRHFV